MKTLKQDRVLAALASCGSSGRPIYRAALSSLSEVKAQGEFLDFGAGSGFFAGEILKISEFTSVSAVDLINYSSDPPNPQIRWFYADLNEAMPCPEGDFDTIVALEVIEHLENPRAMAREFFRLLRPGGVALISTPNNESWRSILSLVLKRHFAAFTGSSYPAHITALLRMDLGRIFSEAGFTSISFRFTDHGALPHFTRLNWQSISCGILSGVRYSDNFICIARKPQS